MVDCMEKAQIRQYKLDFIPSISLDHLHLILITNFLTKVNSNQMIVLLSCDVSLQLFLSSTAVWPLQAADSGY